MTDLVLGGCRVLVVEDEYIVAQDICGHLEAAGAEIIGPMASIAKALAIIAASPRIDAALLDVNVRGEKIFPVADALASRHVPIVFTTGYDRSALPEHYRNTLRCEKPVNMAEMIQTIARAMNQ